MPRRPGELSVRPPLVAPRRPKGAGGGKEQPSPFAGPEIPIPPEQDEALLARFEAWQAKWNGSLPEFIVFEFLTINKKQVQGIDFCPVLGQRVLTGDLRWVPVECLVPGDEVMSFDEYGPRRRWRRGHIIRNERRIAPVYQIRLSDGTELVVTGEHPWITSYLPSQGYNAGQQWTRTKDLHPGVPLLRFMPTWEEEHSWEAGWLAGFYDGEGTLTKVNKERSCWNLVLAQKEGDTLQQALRFLRERGFTLGKYQAKTMQIRINGRMAETLRLLGTIRPQRLLNKAREIQWGTLRKWGEAPRVEEVRPLGEEEICALSVSTSTYFLEGFGAHNSFQHPLFGGRTRFGGFILDFYFPGRREGWRVMGERWHQEQATDRARDALAKVQLAGEGIQIVDLFEDDLLSRPVLILNLAWERSASVKSKVLN